MDKQKTRTERILIVESTVYKHIVTGDRHFYLFQGDDSTDDTIQPTKRRTYKTGDINKTLEMKMPDGSWVYVGKQGKDNPKVKHLFEDGRESKFNL